MAKCLAASCMQIKLNKSACKLGQTCSDWILSKKLSKSLWSSVFKVWTHNVYLQPNRYYLDRTTCFEVPCWIFFFDIDAVMSRVTPVIKRYLQTRSGNRSNAVNLSWHFQIIYSMRHASLFFNTDRTFPRNMRLSIST